MVVGQEMDFTKLEHKANIYGLAQLIIGLRSSCVHKHDGDYYSVKDKAYLMSIQARTSHEIMGEGWEQRRLYCEVNHHRRPPTPDADAR